MKDIIVFDSVSSTNTLLKEMAEKNAKEGLAIAARAQTAGRGRMGRFFFSPPMSGLYMSVLLRPRREPSSAKLLTPMAAVAAARAIEKISGEKTEIKWVNDIYLNGKKICGILTEGGFKGDLLDYAVIGIGVNLEEPKCGFPKEIADIAGSVFKKAPEDAFSSLYKEIYNEIFSLYENFDSRDFTAEYAARCTYLNGKQVTVNDGDTGYEATVAGTDGECRLIVIDRCGKKSFLSSGEATPLLRL